MNYTDKSFLDLTKKEISEIVESFGELPYRSDQLEAWIYKKFVKNWETSQNSISEIKKVYDGGIVLGGFSEYDYLTKRHNFKNLFTKNS
mgnify:CR=1 FL=1